jgi:hypothetical protein
MSQSGYICHSGVEISGTDGMTYYLVLLQDGLVILTIFAQFMSVCSSAGFFYKILSRLQIFLITCHLI